jgi:hypothetical protein
MYWQSGPMLVSAEDVRERVRVASLDRKIQLAREARCAREGCHPIHERISRKMLRLAVRFHQWATPEHRQSPLSVTADHATLTSCNPHGWT